MKVEPWSFVLFKMPNPCRSCPDVNLHLDDLFDDYHALSIFWIAMDADAEELFPNVPSQVYKYWYYMC